jgi:hypothetical protein
MAKTIISHMNRRNVNSFCDLGSINYYEDGKDHTNPPFAKNFWAKVRPNMNYMSIDLNGENGSIQWDLSKPLPVNLTFDVVADLGTSEHVSDFYQCHANIDALCKVNGLIIHENPKTNNWPNHCLNYVDLKFFENLAEKCEYKILELGENFAGNNKATDGTGGGNIYCIMQKTRNGFIIKQRFPPYHTK